MRILEPSSLRQYRLFPVSAAGRIVGAPKAFEAQDDGEAMSLARSFAFGGRAELWASDRLLGRLDGAPAPGPRART